MQYEKPYITIDLKQNSSEKSSGDVDIADVAYYFEKDVSLSWVKSAKDLNVYIALSSLTVYLLKEDELLQCLDLSYLFLGKR